SPNGATVQIDAAITAVLNISVQDIENLLVRLKRHNATLRIKPFEVKHAQSNVRAAIDDVRSFDSCSETINLPFEDLVVHPEERLLIRNLDRLAKNLSGRNL